MPSPQQQFCAKLHFCPLLKSAAQAGGFGRSCVDCASLGHWDFVFKALVVCKRSVQLFCPAHTSPVSKMQGDASCTSWCTYELSCEQTGNLRQSGWSARCQLSARSSLASLKSQEANDDLAGEVKDLSRQSFLDPPAAYQTSKPLSCTGCWDGIAM